MFPAIGGIQGQVGDPAHRGHRDWTKGGVLKLLILNITNHLEIGV